MRNTIIAVIVALLFMGCAGTGPQIEVTNHFEGQCVMPTVEEMVQLYQVMTGDDTVPKDAAAFYKTITDYLQDGGKQDPQEMGAKQKVYPKDAIIQWTRSMWVKPGSALTPIVIINDTQTTQDMRGSLEAHGHLK